MSARSVLAALTAVAAAVTLAACSSSSKPSSSAETASTPAGSQIVVGSICSCSGAQASALARLGDVSAAWAKSVNDAGGINGHPVKMIVKDDGGTPAEALKAAKELVENDHIVALVGDDSLADAAFADYLTSKHIPVVGGIPFEAPFLTHANFFASGSSLPVATIGTFQLAKAAGKQKMGVLFCAESPVCAQLDPIAKGDSALVGVGYTSGKIGATQPNYTAQCLAMKDAGVDALWVAHNASVVQRATAGCAQQGYKPAVISQTTTAAISWLKDPNFEGAQLSSSNAPYTDESIPGVKTFLDAIDKYVPGLRSSDQFSYDVIYPWIAGKLFEAAAKVGSVSPTSTSADVEKGLYALKGETLGGLSSPLSYTVGQPAFFNCYFTLEVKSGQWSSLNGGKPTCLSGTQTAALGSALKSLGG